MKSISKVILLLAAACVFCAGCAELRPPENSSDQTYYSDYNQRHPEETNSWAGLINGLNGIRIR